MHIKIAALDGKKGDAGAAALYVVKRKRTNANWTDCGLFPTQHN